MLGFPFFFLNKYDKKEVYNRKLTLSLLFHLIYSNEPLQEITDHEIEVS